MSYLIDTNIISEIRRKKPDPKVVSWLETRPASSLYLSVLTLGEIRKGIELLDDGQRKLQLLDWLEVELPAFFSGRILPVDMKVANRWGQIMVEAGRPIPVIDSLLAATALTHDLMLVTRNRKDFNYCGLKVIDPWQAT
ncbi:MAG TPA: type II toxin-antitoxin system VapC family toxin [Ghiorsea sp.]|nr:type II toxin-antitoxin system VapC family toxin [Ghiorsea sp.]